jgi:hypothetical protein
VIALYNLDMSKDFTHRRQPPEVSKHIEHANRTSKLVERANQDIKAATTSPSFSKLMQQTTLPLSVGFSKQTQDAMATVTAGFSKQIRAAMGNPLSFDSAVGVKAMKAFEAKMASPGIDMLKRPIVSIPMPPPYDAETAANTAAMADVLPRVVQSVQSLLDQQERTTAAVEELKRSQAPKKLVVTGIIGGILAGIITGIAGTIAIMGYLG